MSPITNGLHFADIKRRMSSTKTPPSLPQISETPGGSAEPTEAEGEEESERETSSQSCGIGYSTILKSQTCCAQVTHRRDTARGTTEERGADQPTYSGQPEVFWLFRRASKCMDIFDCVASFPAIFRWRGLNHF